MKREKLKLSLSRSCDVTERVFLNTAFLPSSFAPMAVNISTQQTLNLLRNAPLVTVGVEIVAKKEAAKKCQYYYQ